MRVSEIDAYFVECDDCGHESDMCTSRQAALTVAGFDKFEVLDGRNICGRCIEASRAAKGTGE